MHDDYRLGQPRYVVPQAQPVPAPVDREPIPRVREVEEVINDSYSAAVQTTSLNTITHMAYDSVASVALHKARVLAEYPGYESELNALMFNHLRGLLEIQRQITDNERDQ